jgi:hypothetical protein
LSLNFPRQLQRIAAGRTISIIDLSGIPIDKAVGGVVVVVVIIITIIIPDAHVTHLDASFVFQSSSKTAVKK